MTRFSRELLNDCNIRRTKKQKANFRKKMVDKFYASGYSAFEERYGLLSNRINLIIGVPENADIIFAANYTTKPTLIFKNYIFPKNKKLQNLYRFIILSLMSIIALFAEHFYFLLTKNAMDSFFSFLVLMVAMLFYCFFGPSFKGANDNTSSVVAICEAILALSPEEIKRRKISFVFFDNPSFLKCAEKAYISRHRKEQTVINLSTIGQGNHLLFMCSKALRADDKLTEKLISCIENHKEKANFVTQMENTSFRKYANVFPKSMYISSFFQTKKGLLYSKNSRTIWDNSADETNIELIARFILNATKKV